MEDFEQPFWDRTKALVGADGAAKLERAHVAVFGIGGVGSYAFEALVRAGIGRICIVDSDAVEGSNCNRQIIALQSTVGHAKVDVAAKRAHDINPNSNIECHQIFLSPENIDMFFNSGFTHAIDAIDSIESKIALIQSLKERRVSFVSCMGGAQRLDPTKIRCADISETFGCPHAKSVRRRLRALGITQGVRSVFSIEQPQPACKEKLGSISYIPGIIGLTAAGIIINDILRGQETSLTNNPRKKY